MVKINMKKHLLVALISVILLSPSSFSLALTPTIDSTLIADSTLSITVAYITNLNTQTKTLITKFKVTDTQTLGTILKDRKNEMLTLMKQSPRVFLEWVEGLLWPIG